MACRRLRCAGCLRPQIFTRHPIRLRFRENQASHRKSPQVLQAVSRDERKKFRLKDVDPGDTQDLKSEDKARAKEALQNGIEALAELQDMLYAQDRWSVLLVFQAMDAAGKDGTIKHVMSGVNPQGCQVSSFKSADEYDLDHDYLWRCMKDLPERGRIGIFNRSYYEETLVVRVHPEFLAGQKLPEECVTKKIWDDASGHPRVRALPASQWDDRAKFFLHVSKKEQQRRFSSGSICRRRIGSSPRTTRRSAAFGTTTWRPTRRPSATRPQRIRRGM
jgi:polyphosphate kinase 2 (PPK2 family)